MVIKKIYLEVLTIIIRAFDSGELDVTIEVGVAPSATSPWILKVKESPAGRPAPPSMLTKSLEMAKLSIPGDGSSLMLIL